MHCDDAATVDIMMLAVPCADRYTQELQFSPWPLA
jgi:hypothetical protein